MSALTDKLGKLKCEVCGAGLDIGEEAHTVKCGQCGAEYRIQADSNCGGRPLLRDNSVYYVETIFDSDQYIFEKRGLRIILMVVGALLVIALAIVFTVLNSC